MPIDFNLYYHHYAPDNRRGAPVLLIHGAGGNYLYWPSEVRRLGAFEVFAPDLPGHGKSEGRGLQSIKGYSDALHSWIEALEIPPLAVIGHSMGGAIALSLALNHPDRVAALGLLATGAALPVAPHLLESASSETTFFNAVDLVIKGCFSPAADERLVELARQRMETVRPSVLHGDFLACSDFDLSLDVQRVSQPTLVLCGEADQMTPARFSQFLAANIPGAQLTILPGAGHMLQLEQPQATAEALNTFLSQHVS
ncbi:MAG TPA: alpha/beta hydrolase [Anaerolineales bacterium]|nr:alpha/beta hydrolase [Anaerolineales bacterium]